MVHGKVLPHCAFVINFTARSKRTSCELGLVLITKVFTCVELSDNPVFCGHKSERGSCISIKFELSHLHVLP